MAWVINEFTEPSDMSDVILVVEGQNLHVNRAVMSHISPVFKTMFNGEFRESCSTSVPLPDKNYDDFVEFLMCVYPSTVKPVRSDNVDVLLSLAEEYQVESLRERCDVYIYNYLTYLNKEPTDSELVHFLNVCGKYKLRLSTDTCVQLASKTKLIRLKHMDEFDEISDEIFRRFTSEQIGCYELSTNCLMTGFKELTRYHSQRNHPDRSACCVERFSKLISQDLKKYSLPK